MDSKYTEFIENYLINDKTKSAIMLTGDWGTGKSYYIQNVLKPYLESKQDDQCIIISLYGLNDVNDISKAIYFEVRAKKLRTKIVKFKFLQKAESQEGAKIAGKTVLKGIASFFNIDLSSNDEDLQRLYESLDLSKKLIILEDLERTNIPIKDVLGYVNNLVEQDGIKVLLVANEREILKSEEYAVENAKGESKGKWRWTAETEEYLKIKEKTVSDTIHYVCDLKESIKDIIQTFKNEQLSYFSSDSYVEDIADLFIMHRISNLRTFIFACQKTVDIFDKMKLDITENEDFLKTIFFSIIIFSNRIKNGANTSWKRNELFSVELASEMFPLFMFCYDYVIFQNLDLSSLESSKDALSKYRLYDAHKSRSDDDLNKLHYWYLYSEKDVITAYESVLKRLEKGNDISFYEYGNIAVHIIAIKYALEIDIEQAKQILIKNLHGKGTDIRVDFLFRITMDPDNTPEAIEEYEKLKSDMINSLYSTGGTLFDFDYKPENIESFSNTIENNTHVILKYKSFASLLNIEKIVNMLKNCSSEQIYEFRRSFHTVYKSANIGEFLGGDKENLSFLLSAIEDLRDFEGYDKIQKKQIGWFIENLIKIISKL